MRRILARDILALTPEQVWLLPDERFILVFDDGELETTTRRTIFSYYHWEVHQHYPKIPLKTAHHIGLRDLTADTMLEILSVCSRDVDEAYIAKDKPEADYTQIAPLGQYKELYDRERLWKLFYEISNEIYNVFSVKLEPYQTSSDILDYLEIFDHPEIAEANANVRPTQISLDQTYRKIAEVMKTSESLAHNPVVWAVRSGLVKLAQVNQIVGPRGYMTDVDSNIFNRPIIKGFFEGITDLYSSMIESRSAVKALTFTKKPLRQVEYFNRKMQLSASNVKSIIMGDCGSDQYIEVKVTTTLLKGMEGKFIRVDDKTLKAVVPADKHLIGKTVLMRSPTKCRYRKGGHSCAVCMGELAYSIPYNTNLGHVSSTEMCQEGSQLVLSVKHYDGSSEVDAMVLSEHDQKFIYEGVNPGTILFNSKLQSAQPYMLLDPTSKPPMEGASGLATLNQRTDIDSLSIHRVTSFRDITIGYQVNDKQVEDYVSVSESGRLGSLSRDMLRYIVQVGYEIDDKGFYRVDLSGWDYSRIAFELPLRHLNMLDYMSTIEVFLRSPTEATRDSRVGSSKKLIDYTSIDEALLDLYEMASSKLSVNIAHLEVLLLSLMRHGQDPNDYRIPGLDEPAMFERHSKLMEMRSMGAGLAYERQPAMIEDVDSYLVTNRDSHILDPMII